MDNMFVIPALPNPYLEKAVKLTLTDTYGDGWNGAKVMLVGTNTGDIQGPYTLASGSGPAYFDVDLITGETYTLQWVSGYWDSEVRLVISREWEGTSTSTLNHGSSATMGCQELFLMGLQTILQASLHL